MREGWTMFEQKKNAEGRSIALSIFTGFPWVVRAYLHILVIFIVAMGAMGVADAYMAKPVFEPILQKMNGFMELVVGAVIGALSAAAKKEFQPSREPEAPARLPGTDRE